MLIHEEDNDYLLPNHETECWITANPYNIHIHRDTNGLNIDIWPINPLADNPISSIYIPITEY